MANLWWSGGRGGGWKSGRKSQNIHLKPLCPLDTVHNIDTSCSEKYDKKNDSVRSETYYTIVPTLLLQPCLYDLPWYQLVSLCFQDILCLWVAISKLYILLGKLLCSIERKIPGMVQRRVLLNLLQFSIISQYHSQKYHNIILHNITISFFSMPPVHCFHIK